MNKNIFWELVEASKNKAGDNLEKQYKLLVVALSRLELSDILKWHQIFSEYQRLSYKEKLWAAAYVINGGCSDDAFDYFRGWLTAQGKDVFIAALSDPDSLADYEEAREDETEFEDMLSVACEAYFKLKAKKDYDGFYEELDKYPLSDRERSEIADEIVYASGIDEKWNEDELCSLLPKLCEKFEWEGDNGEDDEDDIDNDDTLSLEEKIDAWYDLEAFDKIVAAVEATEGYMQDGYLVGMLAVAYNNLEEYAKAKELLLTQKDFDETDAAWHYRLGFALYYLGEIAAAKERFERSLALGREDDDDHIADFIDGCNEYLDTTKSLPEKISAWHNFDRHELIIAAIESLPDCDKTADLICLLARAYNNDDKYAKAAGLLESIREKCENDATWNYRYGYSHYYLDQNENAVQYLRRAIELGDDSEDTEELLKRCLAELNESDSEEDENEASNILMMYEEAEIDLLEAHICKHFGKFDNVFHEIMSDDIHADICIINPTKERNYYTLVTMGMGAAKMNIPKELKDKKLERAEILVTLPPDWKIHSNDERWYWPIRWLKILARLPISDNTWLGWGHTVPNGEPFAENTSLSAVILFEPSPFGEDSYVCELPDGDEINFYQMMPIYDDECTYKLANGAEALQKLLPGDYDMVIDVSRKSFSPPTLPGDPKKRAFLYANEKSKKFWTIHIDGCDYCVNYGKTGTVGKFDVKEWDSPEACEKEAEKLIKSKLKKGYKEYAFDWDSHLYIDNDEIGPHRLTSHPNFAEHFTDEFFYDCGDEEAPFGSDEGSDTLAELEEYIKKNRNVDIVEFPRMLIEDEWEMTYLPPAEPNSLDEQAIKAVLDEYNLYMVDQVIVATAFGQIKIMGEVAERLKYLALRSLKRMQIVARLEGDNFSECLDMLAKGLESFQNKRIYTPSDNAIKIMQYLDCPCQTFEGLLDDDDMIFAYEQAVIEGKAQGYTPLLVVTSDTLLETIEMLKDDTALSTDEYRKKTISEALALNPEEELKSLLEELDEDELSPVGSVKGGEIKDAFTSYWNYDTHLSQEVILAKIPTKNPWELPIYLPMGGFNDCPPPAQQAAIMKRWHEKYGAVPAVVTYDEWEFRLPQPIADKQEALALANEMYAFCYDRVEQYDEDYTIGQLAHTLMQSTAWYFWWD